MKKNTIQTDLFLIILLVLGVVVTYCPVLGNDFIYQWDDQWQVMAQTTENGFNLDNIWRMFSNPFHNQYFPVNQFLYMLVYTFSGGYDAFGFHLFCVLLHLSNVLLIYFLLKYMLRLSGRIQAEWIPMISFITSLLFAIHPLNVESVDWISASKVLAYTFFYLLSMFSYVKYVEKKECKYILLSLILFSCSFGGKEQAVVLPFTLLIIDWLLKRDMKSSTLWLEKCPFFLFSVLFGFVTIYLSHGVLSLPENDYAFWQRAIFGCYSYIEYLFKWLFPIKLLYLYPFPSLPEDPIPNWLLYYPILLVLIVGFFHKVLLQWPLLFGFSFFTINLVMTLHVIPMPRFAIVADRYIYLSSIGLSFIVAYYFVFIYEKWIRGRIYLKLIFACYLLYICVYANLRTRVWHDSDTLKREVRELIDSRDDSLKSY